MPNTGPLPLRCTVCPKRPNFSDVSHLLTHIGSKAHLSHYYKLRVRSVQDSAAARDLALFDAWYSSNNVEDLMSARLSDKERKKSRTKVQRMCNLMTRIDTDVRANLATAPVQTSKAHNAIPGGFSIDPRLEVADIASVPSEFPQTDATRLFDAGWLASQPRLHLWSTQSPSSFTAVPTHDSSPLIPSHFSDETVSHDSASLSTGDWLTSDEVTRLKGAVWPGMDVFDSATEEMRKRRNQRKDISVLAKLERHSLDVQPIEVVYFPLGCVRKEKIITGKPDNESSSPVQSVLSPRTPPRTRRPLADRSINTQGIMPEQGRAPNILPINKKKECKVSTRSFPVFHDGQNDEADRPNMAVLTSAFDPVGQPPHALPSESLNSHIQLPTWTPSHFSPEHLFGRGNVNTDTSFCIEEPTQNLGQFCVPGQYKYWGPEGYDLSGFLAANLSQTNPLQEAAFDNTAQLQALGDELEVAQGVQGAQETPEDSKFTDLRDTDMFLDFENHHDILGHQYSPILRS